MYNSDVIPLCRLNRYCIKYKLIVSIHVSQFLSCILTLLHSERPKLHTIFAFLSAVGLSGLSKLFRLIVDFARFISVF